MQFQICIELGTKDGGRMKGLIVLLAFLVVAGSGCKGPAASGVQARSPVESALTAAWDDVKSLEAGNPPLYGVSNTVPRCTYDPAGLVDAKAYFNLNTTPVWPEGRLVAMRKNRPACYVSVSIWRQRDYFGEASPLEKYYQVGDTKYAAIVKTFSTDAVLAEKIRDIIEKKLAGIDSRRH